MSSLRIAQIMASGPVAGGLEKHFVELCSGLDAEHQVLAIADPIHAANLPEHVEFCPFDFTLSRRNPFNLLRLHRVLQSFRPDVIHAQAHKAAQMEASIRHFSSVKRVATVHNLKRSNRVFKKFDLVICVGPAVQQNLNLPNTEVILNGIVPPQRHEIDPNYIEKTLGLTRRRNIVLATGRLAAAKGFAGLIQAWQGIDADLVIAGEGTERTTLESLIKQLGLQASVHLVGFRKDVHALMANCDLIVISSEREGFPYAMVEALHLQKVIVSTRFPGVERLLPDEYLVPCGNPAQLQSVVQRTLGELENAKCKYTSAWDFAKRELTVDKMVFDTVQAYHNVLRKAA